MVNYPIVLYPVKNDFLKVRFDRLVIILEKFKSAEKGLNKNSTEFSFLPKETLEYYLDILENDFKFIKELSISDKDSDSMEYRITVQGNDFLLRYKKTKNPIGF